VLSEGYFQVFEFAAEPKPVKGEEKKKKPSSSIMGKGKKTKKQEQEAAAAAAAAMAAAAMSGKSEQEQEEARMAALGDDSPRDDKGKIRMLGADVGHFLPGMGEEEALSALRPVLKLSGVAVGKEQPDREAVREATSIQDDKKGKEGKGKEGKSKDGKTKDSKTKDGSKGDSNLPFSPDEARESGGGSGMQGMGSGGNKDDKDSKRRPSVLKPVKTSSSMSMGMSTLSVFSKKELALCCCAAPTLSVCLANVTVEKKGKVCGAPRRPIQLP
jgi:hypothetical protein